MRLRVVEIVIYLFLFCLGFEFDDYPNFGFRMPYSSKLLFVTVKLKEKDRAHSDIR